MPNQSRSQPRTKRIPSRRINPATPIPEIPMQPMNGAASLGAGMQSVVTDQRRYYQKLTRVNPIRRLEPATLSRIIDDFHNGYLREFALLMHALAGRDDVLTSVIPKRKASVKRLKFQVIINEDVPEGMEEEAEEHKNALYYFYNNLTCSDATDANIKAGWPTFVDQMLDAIGHKYAVHEIIWRPTPEGLAATFNKVPLWFFENRTGKMRFLPTDFAVYGDELEPNAWLVTAGPGLLEPCAVAAMFKGLSFRDWVLYNERHGMPGIHGETTAPFKSPQWEALEQAVASVATNFSCVTAAGDKINKLDFSAQGSLPYQPFVQRMDEAMMWIWRGGSMSTQGSKTTGPEMHGVGLQGDEEFKLTCDDSLLITETLNTQIDPFVIEWNFGRGVKPLAFVKVAPPAQKDLTKDMDVFKFLMSYGIKIGKRQLSEHFSVPEMDDEDEPAENPMEALLEEQGFGQHFDEGDAGDEGDEDEETSFANESHLPEVDAMLLQEALRQVAQATSEAFTPLRERLETILELPTQQSIRAAVIKLREDMPQMLREINATPENAEPLERLMTASWFNGLIGANVNRY